MTPKETIIKLEWAALTAQAEHRYDSVINFHSEAITQTEGLDRPWLRAMLFYRLGRALETEQCSYPTTPLLPGNTSSCSPRTGSKTGRQGPTLFGR